MIRSDIRSSSINKIYQDILKKLYNAPDYKSTNKEGDNLHELIDFSFSLEDTKRCFITIRNMSFPYLQGELRFYYSGSPFLRDVMKLSKFWGKVTDDNRTIVSNYGKLLLHDRNYHGYTQLEHALACLLKNRDSKSAVMTIYSNEHSYPSNDNPCTMYLHFRILNDKLHLYVKMRSSDVWYGLPYDIPFFISIQYLMKDLYNYSSPDKQGSEFIEVGTYNHQAGSLHFYDRNMGEILEVMYRDLHLCELDSEQSDRTFEKYILDEINYYKLKFIKEHADGYSISV